jgi:hypothetical protein
MIEICMSEPFKSCSSRISLWLIKENYLNIVVQSWQNWGSRVLSILCSKYNSIWMKIFLDKLWVAVGLCELTLFMDRSMGDGIRQFAKMFSATHSFFKKIFIQIELHLEHRMLKTETLSFVNDCTAISR